MKSLTFHGVTSLPEKISIKMSEFEACISNYFIIHLVVIIQVNEEFPVDTNRMKRGADRLRKKYASTLMLNSLLGAPSRVSLVISERETEDLPIEEGITQR